MIQIENTVLGNEIMNIIGNESASAYNIKHSIILHTKELDIPIFNVESVEIMRDYNNNISDYVVATFLIGMGDYVKDVHPFRDNLMLTLTRNINGVKFRDQYKFVILNNQEGINGTRYTRSSRDELNQLEKARVIGQCVDTTVEVLRLQNVSGVYKHTDVSTLMKYELHKGLNSVKVNGVVPEVTFNIVEPHNNRVYQHITVPTGVKVLDLPSFLQDREYGVYNGGIGTYLQNYSCLNCPDKSLFVYPLYNKDVFDNAKKKLVIYGVNSVKFDMVEHTYLVDGDLIKMIAGGTVVSIDNSDNENMDYGNGYTLVDPNTIIERNTLVTDKGIVMDTDNTNLSGIPNERKDGTNKTVHLGPEDNAYKFRSKLLKSNMATFQIKWNHANPELLYPGMPVMYNYVDNEYGLVKLKGSLQSLFIMYTEGTKTVSAVMNIMVEKPYNDITRTISKHADLAKRG